MHGHREAQRIGGTVLGIWASRRLSGANGMLNTIFASGIVVVALYML
ncbi:MULTISPECIES: hypothetical protein [unclassified Novosphingobium]|nr:MULTISPECIES: hypothetical protein [unclassified Novosphingobium]